MRASINEGFEANSHREDPSLMLICTASDIQSAVSLLTIGTEGKSNVSAEYLI